MIDGLPDLLIQRGWRCFRYGRDPAYLMDAATGSLSAVPETLLANVPHVPPRHSGAETNLTDFTRALAAGTSPPSSSARPNHELHLALLGGRILARFANARCRDDVARYFSCCVDGSGSSPDVIVECDWEQADRYLFRARPEEFDGASLEGVHVQAFGETSPEPWSSAQPPFPPLSVAPFKGRFVALHAATLRDPCGDGLAIVGGRNSGKSTCALEFGRRCGFEFLTDETTFIHLRTTVAEPFPQSVGLWSDDGRKVPVPAVELFPRIARGPAVIQQVIILEPSEEVSYRVEELKPAAALRALLPHHRDAAASLDEAMVTLDHLARNACSIRVRYGNSAALTELLERVL